MTKIPSAHKIKNLDGIRVISILMVLLGHTGFSLPKSVTNNFIYQVFANIRKNFA